MVVTLWWAGLSALFYPVACALFHGLSQTWRGPALLLLWGAVFSTLLLCGFGNEGRAWPLPARSTVLPL